MLTLISTTDDLDPAFLELVSAYEDGLLRAARLLTGDWAAGETLLRGTLAWALAGWDVLAADEDPGVRLQQRLVASYLAGADTAGAVPVDGSGLVPALATLDPEDRALVVAHYYLELTAAEVAEILGADAADVSDSAARILSELPR
jgi:hypothetical protein